MEAWGDNLKEKILTYNINIFEWRMRVGNFALLLNRVKNVKVNKRLCILFTTK